MIEMRWKTVQRKGGKLFFSLAVAKSDSLDWLCRCASCHLGVVEGAFGVWLGHRKTLDAIG